MCSSVKPHVIVVCYMYILIHPGSSVLTPLTEIQATRVELDAFHRTLLGAFDKLHEHLQSNPSRLVVHMLGASEVELAVNWSMLCNDSNTQEHIFLWFSWARGCTAIRWCHCESYDAPSAASTASLARFSLAVIRFPRLIFPPPIFSALTIDS
eukprot:m.209766 g.209766  ORF g.209766 m.209766 type:complete len:153 (-) comp15819_c0_seq7:417-875(-)